MKKYLVIAAAAIFATSTVLADNWDLGQNSVTLGIADVDLTVSPDFHGTKLLLGGRYIFQREPATAYKEPDAEILNTGLMLLTSSMVIHQQTWNM